MKKSSMFTKIKFSRKKSFICYEHSFTSRYQDLLVSPSKTINKLDMYKKSKFRNLFPSLPQEFSSKSFDISYTYTKFEGNRYSRFRDVEKLSRINLGGVIPKIPLVERGKDLKFEVW